MLKRLQEFKKYANLRRSFGTQINAPNAPKSVDVVIIGKCIKFEKKSFMTRYMLMILHI